MSGAGTILTVFSLFLFTESQYLILSGGSLNTPINSDTVYNLINTVITSYYTWQTGATNGQYTGINNSRGDLLPIAGPLVLNYSDPKNNNSFFMNYYGIGNLQGIPLICELQDTGVIADPSTCQQDNGTVWRLFNIPDGSELNDFNNNHYWIRPVYTVQTIPTVSNDRCASVPSISNNMAAAALLNLPTESGYVINGVNFKYITPPYPTAADYPTKVQ